MARTGLHSKSPAAEIDPSESTKDFYETHARDYFDRTVSADLSAYYERFLKHVKPGGRILDAGCGSGRDLKVFRDRGFEVLGVDASQALVKLAAQFSGANCLVIRLEDLNFEHAFDAVWACASLLHVPKLRLLPILQRLYLALVEGGLLFASVQLGRGERHLPDGRFFAYYALDEFAQSLKRIGFSINESWVSEDALPSRRRIRWVNIIARRETNLRPAVPRSKVR
jgi:SAM-dependent methyltransferase